MRLYSIKSRLLALMLLFASNAVCAQVSGGLPPLKSPALSKPKAPMFTQSQSESPKLPLGSVGLPNEIEKNERGVKLQNCLDGSDPALCNRSQFTSPEMSQVESAEKRENLKRCLDGRYPALCKHQLLTSIEQQQVESAEKRENLKRCLDGRYPALCNKKLLHDSRSQ